MRETSNLSNATIGTVLNVTVPDFQVFSGFVGYIENFTGVQRSSDSIEFFKIVLGY